MKIKITDSQTGEEFTSLSDVQSILDAHNQIRSVDAGKIKLIDFKPGTSQWFVQDQKGVGAYLAPKYKVETILIRPKTKATEQSKKPLPPQNQPKKR